MKRIALFVLTCILVLTVFSGSALAIDNSRTYNFDLTVNGSHNAAIKVGDKITVKFTLSTNDSYPLYAMQNEIMYDTDYLQLVPGSIKVDDLFRSGTRDMSDNSYSKVLMNYVSSAVDGETINPSVVVGTCQLKAVAVGTTSVSNEDCYATNKTGSDRYASTTSDLTVKISKASSSSDDDEDDTTTAEKHKITINSVTNGTVSVSPNPAKEDAKVKITTTPDSGYETGSVVVVDEDGNKITVSKQSDNTYTFTMPDCTVTVKVSFEPVQTTEKPTSLWQSFTDIHNHWAKESICYVVDKGLFNGTTATTFSPNDNVTRGMMVTVLYRLEGEPSATVATFSDVVAGSWYANGVYWASANSVVEGYGNNLFGPEDSITREQLATILYRYAKLKGDDISPRTDLVSFPDHAQVSSYAREAIQWAVSTGIISGNSSGQLNPKGNATRAEVSTMLMRFMNLYNK